VTVRVLLLGSGGREHALAVALAADPAVSTLTCAPGNPGIAAVRLAATGAPVELAELDLLDVVAVAARARETADLVVVGPEAPLMAGVADVVRRAGVACFGPSRAAALLEGSKAFAKDLMSQAGVPTSRSHAIVDPAGHPEQLAAALDEFGAPYVVKDDGLAAGKGVVVTFDRAAAVDHAIGCDRVVVEEHMFGPEVSLFVVTDGVAAVPLLPAQDFKRIGDGDTGPNTGGMGAYAPLPWLPSSVVDNVMSTVVHPTLKAMTDKGTPFVGLLYVGLMITSSGPRVIEFNCRFGDPETQAVLALLDTPLAGLLHAAATGALATHPPLRWRAGSAVTVVVAATGYPQTPRRGDVIGGADGAAGVLHSGTARDADGALVSAGGRVLACTATGPTLSIAREAAYALVDGVSLADSQHRRDIALAASRDEIAIPVA
jgi:phosphoribosylamine--glycine ligase